MTAQHIEVKKFYGLGDAVFDPPPSRIVAHQLLQAHIEIIGNHKGRFFSTVATNDHLALSFVISQFCYGFVRLRVGVFSFSMINMDFFPALELIDLLDHGASTASQCDELDTILAVEFGQLRARSKL
jgi:hypothetical protein